MEKKFRPETLCVQAGWQPTKGEPRVLPIYQSTTFKYDTSEQMARLFDLEDSGYFYTRLQNPSTWSGTVWLAPPWHCRRRIIPLPALRWMWASRILLILTGPSGSIMA